MLDSNFSPFFPILRGIFKRTFAESQKFLNIEYTEYTESQKVYLIHLILEYVSLFLTSMVETSYLITLRKTIIALLKFLNPLSLF